jgi:hypothetical protein
MVRSTGDAQLLVQPRLLHPAQQRLILVVVRTNGRTLMRHSFPFPSFQGSDTAHRVPSDGSPFVPILNESSYPVVSFTLLKSSSSIIPSSGSPCMQAQQQ